VEEVSKRLARGHYESSLHEGSSPGANDFASVEVRKIPFIAILYQPTQLVRTRYTKKTVVVPEDSTNKKYPILSCAPRLHHATKLKDKIGYFLLEGCRDKEPPLLTR
jgi:hypothetical protein